MRSVAAPTLEHGDGERERHQHEAFPAFDLEAVPHDRAEPHHAMTSAPTDDDRVGPTER